MKTALRLLILGLMAAVWSDQTNQLVPVYTDFGTVKQVVIGTDKCLMWTGLTGYYKTEMACYSNGTLDTLGVATPGFNLLMEYNNNGNTFSLLYYVDNGVQKYQIAATPTGGLNGLIKEGAL